MASEPSPKTNRKIKQCVLINQQQHHHPPSTTDGIGNSDNNKKHPVDQISSFGLNILFLRSFHYQYQFSVIRPPSIPNVLTHTHTFWFSSLSVPVAYIHSSVFLCYLEHFPFALPYTIPHFVQSK